MKTSAKSHHYLIFEPEHLSPITFRKHISITDRMQLENYSAEENRNHSTSRKIYNSSEFPDHVQKRRTELARSEREDLQDRQFNGEFQTIRRDKCKNTPSGINGEPPVTTPRSCKQITLEMARILVARLTLRCSARGLNEKWNRTKRKTLAHILLKANR